MTNLKQPEEYITLPSSSVDIPTKLHLNVEHFSSEQAKYLEELVKFSPSKKRVKVISRENTSRREETYIKENFAYLDIDDQVDFNDHKNNLQKAKTNCYMVGTGVFLASMGYYIIKTPVTRGLFKEGLKSLVFGFTSAYGFYKYNHHQYLDTVHHYYREIIFIKQAKREKRYSNQTV